MGDERACIPGLLLAADDRRAKGNPLGFSLEFREGVALVTLGNRKIERGLLVENLTLEVPEVRFPFDVAGGAEQFRHHRCRLRILSVSMHQDDLARAITGLLDAARYGLSNLLLTLDLGHGLLSGQWSVGKESAAFTARFVAEPLPDLGVRVGFSDIRLFGPLPLPATTLVSQLGRALQPLRAEVMDCAILGLHPVRDLLRYLLPAHGWKIPETEGLRIDRIEMADGRCRLVVVRYPDELTGIDRADKASGMPTPLEREYLMFKEGVEAYHSAELALQEGRLEDARKLYLGKGGVEPAHPHAARRMLELSVVRPERFDEVGDLVRDLLDKDPEFIPAILTRAVLEERSGDMSAGATYEQIGQIFAKRGERHDAIVAHLKAASLLQQADPKRATFNYERVLELDPDHLQAIRLLADMYEREQQWYRAVRMYLRLAHHLDDPVEVSLCHLRMGTLFLEQFDDLEQARKHLDAALTHDPGNLRALAVQATIRKKLGQPTRAVKLLLQLCENADPAKHKDLLLETRLRLAQLWEEDLNDPAGALLQYERILAESPDHLQALYKVGSISTAQGRWDQAATAFSRLLDMESSGKALPKEVVKSTCLALGKISMSRPGGEEEARQMLRRASQLDEDDLAIWLELERLDRKRENWADLLDVLEKKVRLLKDPESVLASVLEAARISDRRLGDRKRAEKFYRQALQSQVFSGEAVDGLTVLLRDEGRWQELDQVLVLAAAQESNPKAAARCLAEAAGIRVERLNDPQAGIEVLKRVAELDPQDWQSAKRLLQLLREQGRFEDLVSLVARISGEGWEVGELTGLWLERAQIQDEKLGRSDEAEESYKRALAIDPGLLPAHRALADLYFSRMNWSSAREEVLQVFACAGGSGLSAQNRTEAHRRLAIIEMALGNRGAAIEQYRTVLERIQDDEDTASKLGQLLREEERWEDLAQFYALRAERVQGEDAAALHTASASLWWQKQKALSPAAEQYQKAVDAAPRSEGVSARLASLQRVFAGLGRWSDVIRVLNARSELCDPQERAAIHMAQAAILTSRLNDKPGATACWLKALQIDPNYRPAMLMLARRCLEEGNFEEVLKYATQALAEGTGGKLPVERRAALAIDAARAAWTLERHEDATRLYLQHLEAFAQRQFAGANPEALERLELLLRKQRRYEELVLLYRRWLASGILPDRKGGLRRSLALLLFEHLEQPDEAIGILTEQVHEVPQDQPAVQDLLTMLRQSNRWEQLAQLLAFQWERAPHDYEKIKRLEELAEIFQLRLHQPEEAIERWKQLLQLGHDVATERLSGLLHKEGRHAELADLLQQQAENATDPQEALRCYLELGKLARDKLADPERALNAFRRVSELEPSSKSRGTMLELLRDIGDAERLEEYLVACAEAEEDPQQKRKILLEHAELCLTKLRNNQDALTSLKQAIDLEADEATVHRTQLLCEKEGDWEGVADLQEILIDLAEDEAAAARRTHRLGRVFLEHFDSPERAAAAFEKASELDPIWMVPLIDLSALFEQEKNWQKLIDLELRIARLLTNADEKSEHLRKAGRLVFDRLADGPRGIELLEGAADELPDPTPVLLELAERCEAVGMLSQAADALERLVVDSHESTESSGPPAVLFRRLADLRSRAGEQEFAIAALEQALRLEPSDQTTAELLEAIYRSNGRFDDLAMMLEELAGRKTGRDAADTWVAAAKNWLEAGKANLAEIDLRKGLANAPKHEIATQLVSGLMAKRGAWRELLGFLESLSESSLEQAELKEAVRGCFTQITSQPDNQAQLRSACRLMLRIEPDNLQALQHLIRLLRESGEAEEAEAILRKIDLQAERLDPAERYELDMQLATIDFSRGKSEEAERRIKRCIEVRPEDPTPRDFLHKLYTGGQRFADQVTLLLEEAEQAPSKEESFAKLSQAAELMETELGDPQSAAVVYERILQEDSTRLEDWRRLAFLQRLLDNPEKQREALLRVAELAPELEAIQAMRKATILAHDVLKNTEAARQGWTNLLEMVPEDMEVLDRLLDLDRQEGAFVDLDRHLEARASACDDQGLRINLLRERASLLVEKLERTDEGIAVLEEIEQLVPRDGSVLIQLSDLYPEAERWADLARVVTKQVKLAGSEKDRAVLLSKLARLRHERLNDFAGSVDSYRKAAALDPDNSEPLQQLRLLAAERGDDDLMVEVLEALAARAGSEAEECELRRGVGLLRWHKGQKDEARRTFARVLALDANDLVGRRFTAELLFELDPPSAVPHLRWLLDHIEVLAPHDLRKVHRQLVAALADADPRERIDALEKLLQVDTNDLKSARALAELYKETRNHRALADLLARMGDMGSEVEGANLWIQRAEILLHDGDLSEGVRALVRALEFEGDHRYELALRLAKIQLQDLKDEAAAAGTLETALSIRPEDGVALRQLAELCWSMGNYEKAQGYTGQLLMRVEGEQRVPLLLRMGDIQLKLNQQPEARQFYEMVVQLDPANRQAYQRLEPILKASEQDAELAAFFLHWAKSPAAGSRRVALYIASARHLERSGDLRNAVRVFREALRLDPTNVEVCEALAPLLSREGQWEDLLEVLQQRLEMAGEPARKLALAFEMGEVCKEHLRDLGRAASFFEQCLQIDALDAGALEELADICYGRKDIKRAAELYQRLDERGLSSRWFVLAFRRGEIAETLGEHEAAAVHYRRSTELNPTFIPSRQNLIQVLSRLGRFEDVVEAIEGLLFVLPSEEFEDLALDLWRQLGRTQRRLLRFDDAVGSFQQVLKRNPQDQEAVRFLKNFAFSGMRWAEAAIYARRELELLPETPDASLHWMALGDICFQHLGKTEEAKLAYREAVRLAPMELAPKSKLWRVLCAGNEHKALIEVGEAILATPHDAGLEAEVHRVLGQAYLKVGKSEAALDHLEQTLLTDSVGLTQIDAVANLARAHGRWPLYASLAGQALEARIAQGLDPAEVTAGYLALANVYQEKLQDIAKAAACIRRALELQPRSVELLHQLGVLYASDFETYREAIEVFRELAGMDPTAPELFRYLGRLEAARGDADRAACYYSGLRMLQPMDEEARKYLTYVGPAVVPSRPLNRSEWDEVVLHPAADCLLQRIMSLLAPYLEQLFPPDLARYGVTREHLVNRNNYPQLSEATENANRFLAGRPLSVFVIPGNNSYQAWLESGKTPAILVSSAVLERSSPAEIAFFMAREVAKAAMGFVMPRKLSRSDLLQMLSLLCTIARPEAEPPVPLPKTAPQYLNAINHVTPSEVMESVIPLVRRYALEPRAHDLDRWLSGVLRTADRVGLLVSGDLTAALSVLARVSEAAGGRDLAFIPDRGALLGRDNAMMALYRFAFSEPYLQLRRGLGGVVSGAPATQRARE